MALSVASSKRSHGSDADRVDPDQAATLRSTYFLHHTTSARSDRAFSRAATNRKSRRQGSGAMY